MDDAQTVPPAGVTYATGAATLRSSAHRAVYSKARWADRGPVTPSGPLPRQVRNVELFDAFVVPRASLASAEAGACAFSMRS
jgi:hypothetical protein